MQTSPATTARRFLRWEYAPEAVLVAGLSAFLIDQTDAATSALKSTKALAIMAAGTAGWLAARLLLARLVRLAPARAAVFSIAAAVALSVVVLPAYDNETVIESFPAAAAAPAEPPAVPASPAPPALDPAATAAATPPPMATAEKTATPPPAAVTSTTARATTAATPVPTTAALPPPAPSTTSTTATGAADTPGSAPASSAAAPAPGAPAGPQRLRSGPIRGIDHRASGTAVIYRQPDGRYVVGLEDIDIQPGPDYDLYVVPGEDREDTEGGTRLGDLRGNRGTQFYEVPEGVNLEDGPWTVLVWCQTFAVPVAGSTPS